MAEMGPDGLCHPTPYTYAYWAMLFVIGITSGVLGIRAVLRARDTFRFRQFKLDTLIITCVVSELGLVVWTIRTAIWLSICMSDSEEYVHSRPVLIAEGISVITFAWTGYLSTFFFVLTVVRLLLRASQLSSIQADARDFSRQAKIWSVIGGLVTIAGVAPLYLLQYDAWRRIFTACLATPLLLAVSRIPVTVRKLGLGQARTQSALIMSIFNDCSVKLLFSLTLFISGSVFYVIVWFVGVYHSDSPYLLGQGRAVGAIMEYWGAMSVIFCLDFHHMKLIRLRANRSDKIVRNKSFFASRHPTSPTMANASFAVTPRGGFPPQGGLVDDTTVESPNWESKDDNGLSKALNIVFQMPLVRASSARGAPSFRGSPQEMRRFCTLE